MQIWVWHGYGMESHHFLKVGREDHLLRDPYALVLAHVPASSRAIQLLRASPSTGQIKNKKLEAIYFQQQRQRSIPQAVLVVAEGIAAPQMGCNYLFSEFGEWKYIHIVRRDILKKKKHYRMIYTRYAKEKTIQVEVVPLAGPAKKKNIDAFIR